MHETQNKSDSSLRSLWLPLYCLVSELKSNQKNALKALKSLTQMTIFKMVVIFESKYIFYKTFLNCSHYK